MRLGLIKLESEKCKRRVQGSGTTGGLFELIERGK